MIIGLKKINSLEERAKELMKECLQERIDFFKMLTREEEEENVSFEGTINKEFILGWCRVKLI
jgi:hypothetical protein